MFQGLANRGLATNISFHGLGFGNQHFRLAQFKALRFGNHFSWRPRPSRQNLCLSKRGLVWLKLGAMFFLPQRLPCFPLSFRPSLFTSRPPATKNSSSSCRRRCRRNNNSRAPRIELEADLVLSQNRATPYASSRAGGPGPHYIRASEAPSELISSTGDQVRLEAVGQAGQLAEISYVISCPSFHG